MILETLEHQFPVAEGYGTLYPSSLEVQRPLIRGFASFWTDRPFFRVTTGLIPPAVWRTHFGTDRSNLIGHRLDAEKLARKVPQNLSGLDLHLSLLEPLLSVGDQKKWIFPGDGPSAADIALWYQLDWGEKISRGEGIADLTGQSAKDGGDGEGMHSVFNRKRYPGLTAWFERVKSHFDSLPNTFTRVEKGDEQDVNAAMEKLKQTPVAEQIPLMPTPAGSHEELDARNNLKPGVEVSIAPDDTGRNSPTRGNLVAITPEEVVITPLARGTVGDVRVHFPRIGFVVIPVHQGRAKL